MTHSSCEKPPGAISIDTRDAAKPDSSSRHGVVAVASQNGLFLAIRRSLFVRAPGAICFPGGHVEPGETEPEAVVRECMEELSLEVKPLECLWRSQTRWGVLLGWWRVELGDVNLISPHPAEVAEVLWLSAHDLTHHPDLLVGNQEFLEMLSSST